MLDETELILPFSDVLDSSNPTETSTANTSDCRVFGGLIANISDDTYRGGFAVALDRYDIEDGGRFKLEKGMVSGLLTNLDAVIIGTEEFISVDSSLHFKDYEYAGDSSTISVAHSDSIPFVADGIILGMKFRLWVKDSDTRFATNNQSCTTASNTTLTVADSSILQVGMVVSGTGIPTGTKISSITNTTTVVLDTAATDSATKTLTFIIQDATILSSNGNVYKNKMIVDGKNMKDSMKSLFKDMAKDVIAQIVKMIAQMIIMRTIMASLGMTSPSLLASGGGLTGFFSGIGKTIGKMVKFLALLMAVTLL